MIPAPNNIMNNDQFQRIIENKYEIKFELVAKDKTVHEMFTPLNRLANIDTYVRLLSYLDDMDVNNFKRFFNICMKSNFPEYTYSYDSMRNNIVCQLLCVLCMQYYFV